jgi:hypothetical protein
MKRILEVCQGDAPLNQSSEIVKLRLRGRGSGFIEGPNQQESDEPLHLCISSRFYDKYKIACDMAQELLVSIYEEYKKHCEKLQRDLRIVQNDTASTVVVNGILQVKKSE